MKKAKVSMEGERWVNCPVCGNRIMKARSADVDEKCEICGNTITIYATKWFVTTIVNDEENDNESFTDRMNRYKKALEMLTN
ncbi:hypothetical protein [Butyrivibrio sp. YAB3001]|uniref:hypothetical protein n=1 Tax=Butyrivibrio sp. YAB3001 TaxID=1520812 RepID=UPI000B84ACC7|nr:hypothetical protein [Butyrivibrio sp. YAB3001]